MRFKVGDKVQLIYHPIGHLKVEDICTVKSIESENTFNVLEYPSGLMRQDCWRLVSHKKTPISEIDYLDAFQNNFKDGI